MFQFIKRPSRFQIYGLAVLAVAVAILPIALVVTPASAASNAAPPNSITFKLKPGPNVLNCVRQNQTQPPKATVTVTRGTLNDTMTITLSNIRKNTDFDVFTVQNSPLDSHGVPTSFTNFGMAWYQSDLHSDSNGNGSVKIQTILLDQIFGFDAATGLPPTHTFHVGFWFNNPNVPFNGGCEPGKTSPVITPFNGEQHAGILAMISTPKAATGLGPLCTNPSTTPGVCNP